MPAVDMSSKRSRLRDLLLLFVASFLALYLELVLIRYLSTEVRVFAYLKNLVLIASFLGLGLGMSTNKPLKALRHVFPFLGAALFLIMAYAPLLRLTHLPFPNGDYLVWGEWNTGASQLGILGRYFGAVFGILALVVAFCLPLGKIVGEHFAALPGLLAYGVNIAGSLAGVLAFTLLSFMGMPPVVWIALGFIAALPFFIRDPIAIIVFTLTLVGVLISAKPNIYWSPYYQIILEELPRPVGWLHPSAYTLSVNHDYHQRMVDLSPAFVGGFPEAEPNRSALSTYELPFRLVNEPREVLIVGAGTGNDVAAALRHGAMHVDAVEIDPVIENLGYRYHPEHPYDSDRVTVHLDDARAFFKKAEQHGRRYDLIVFGYLDSHTLLTSYSSLRLDNFVYTRQSFQEARKLLKGGGTLVLAFGGGRTFVTDRLFATLEAAFGVAPRAYMTGYDSTGVVFVEGVGSAVSRIAEFPEISADLKSRRTDLLATDDWPFLYLVDRRVPMSILLVLFFFGVGILLLIDRVLKVPRWTHNEYHHLFLLGAGFLLLETRGVMELSLVFGSTWVVNAVVIAAFLAMGFLANALVMRWSVPRRLAYVGLFVSLGINAIFPHTVLDGLPVAGNVLGSSVLVGLPVFFSGLVFSRSFAGVARPIEGLGANLLGAALGGAMENLVMILGIKFLGVLALIVYALSALRLSPRGWFFRRLSVSAAG